ncbi:MAG: hypothetical protein DCC58_12960 [Chloroflexi bacterium]|nr:MAG: hypothetical protein DCC58_12960 [Chloroflexota bacterium]
MPDPARLLAVARGLEDDGQYNVAKLFRAAAYGALVRSARARPRIGEGLAEAAAAAIDDLRAAGAPPELIAAMERGIAAALAGEWASLEELPPTAVCRDCGRVVLSDTPVRCPECGAHELTLWDIAPNYYLDPLPVEAIGPALARGLAEVEALASGVSDEAAELGVWPMREIVAHLLASEQLLVGRARRMLAEGEPRLVSVSPDDITAGVAAVEPTLTGLLRAYGVARRATLDLVGVLAGEDWQRAGFHPEWGRVTVQQQLGYVARHEASHLAELARRRAGE